MSHAPQLTVDSNAMQHLCHLLTVHATHQVSSGGCSVFRNHLISDSGHTLATDFALINAKGNGP